MSDDDWNKERLIVGLAEQIQKDVKYLHCLCEKSEWSEAEELADDLLCGSLMHLFRRLREINQ